MEQSTLLRTLIKNKTAAKRMDQLGLRVASDLLYYFPFRYEDFRQMVPIKQLRDGQAVTVRGTLELIASRRSFKSRKIVTEALVSDDTGSLRVVWFNQPFITKLLKPGDVVFLSGTVKADMLGAQLVSPLFEKESAEDRVGTARLLPVYPSTQGLTQKQIRSVVKQILPLTKDMPDFVPDAIIEEYDLLTLSSALEGIHCPESPEHLKAATDRLKFDELFLIQLAAEDARAERMEACAPALVFHEKEIKDFVATLPFALTKTQKIAAWEILQNIAKPTPMNRLLSGDVGSGKTVVAALALYNTALCGYQGVIMAPTEILARQHYESLRNLLPEVRIALFTRSQKMVTNISDRAIGDKSELDNLSPIAYRLSPEGIPTKKKIVELIRKGEVDIIIGTQALLSEGVDFHRLGLVIVDEQHRFGVAQRKIMKEKGRAVHFLSMTATPIPRSLALMVYGDLDVSVINELPPGRKKIMTRLVEPLNRQKAYAFIEQQIKAGRQAFVVCPLIQSPLEGGEGDVRGRGKVGFDDKKSVTSEYEKLSKQVFPHLRVGFLHGKMKGEEKEAIMTQFKNRQLDILVATSVIEVGVNIPNASVMMVEGADRFGLAQLHQFRGRVGRSEHQSYCMLFTDADSPRALERLRYFETHHDGFSLAEKDLEIRGPGEVYGTEQSGMMQLRIATLVDRDLIKKAREAAKNIAPQINRYPILKKKLQSTNETIHLE